jgi:hypothetical protein
MRSFSSVVFFNNANNGDVFYSKEFVRFFAGNLNAKAYHSHFKCPSLISDLGIPFIRVNTQPLQNISMHIENEILFLNTWIAQNDKKWWDGCTLHNNYRMYLDHANTLGLSSLFPKEEHFFIPDIDYKHYGVDDFCLPTDKNVFVSNGPVLSGQTVNWNMTEMIVNLAKKHSSCSFYITQPIDAALKNVFDANQWFDFGGRKSNLNELSKLASLCDIIVGRSSGPYSFTHTKSNLFNPNKTYICSSNGRDEGHWGGLWDYNIPQKAKQLWVECHVHKNSDCSGDLLGMVDDEIKTKYGSN